MDTLSSAELARQSDAIGQEIVLKESTPLIEEMAPEAAARLDRRRFLKSGAFTVAGLATLSGVELVRSPLALAQTSPITTVAPVQNFELLSASATPVGAGPLHVCRHHYRFEYHAGQSVPPDLVETYRLNVGPTFAPGGVLADRLQPIMQPAPFQNPQLAPAGFPPAPSQVPPTGTPSPQQLLPFVCYRLAQVIQLQTFPPRTIVRVFDWCSLYCYPGNIVVIVAGDQCVCYRIGTGGGQPPPQPQKNIVDDQPQFIGSWFAFRSNSQHSINGVYNYTFNAQTGAPSTAVWRAQLNVPDGTQCRVDAFIPGASQPQNRTAGARYQIFSANFVSNVVVRSQQLSQSQWVTLGTFPFRPGTFEVRLTNETGEASNSRIVVADAIRWVG